MEAGESHAAVGLEDLARYETGGINVRVRGDSRERAASLLAAWSGMRSAAGRARITYDLVLNPSRKRLVVDGRVHYTAGSTQDILDSLELDLYRRITRLSAATPLHAAAVALPRGAVVLVGPSGAGKSTLTRELLRRGARYLADEHVFLQQDGAVTGLARSIQLTPDPVTHAPLQYAAPPDRIVHSPQHPRLVVLLQRARTSDATVRRVENADAMLQLLSSVLRTPRPTDLSAIAHLVKDAPVGSLARDGVAESARLVIDALGSIDRGRPR